MGVRLGFSEGPIGSGDRRRMKASSAEKKHLQTYGSGYGAEKVHLDSGESVPGGVDGTVGEPTGMLHTGHLQAELCPQSASLRRDLSPGHCDIQLKSSSPGGSSENCGISQVAINIRGLNEVRDKYSQYK